MQEYGSGLHFTNERNEKFVDVFQVTQSGNHG